MFLSAEVAKWPHIGRCGEVLPTKSGGNGAVTCHVTLFRSLLGSVDVSSQEYACGGEMDEGEVSPCKFIEACEDASIVFHVTEHDLDFVAFFIERPIGFSLV